MTTITLPLTEKQAQALAAAALALGVETWELAVHALWWKSRYFGPTGDE